MALYVDHAGELLTKTLVFTAAITVGIGVLQRRLRLNGIWAVLGFVCLLLLWFSPDVLGLVTHGLDLNPAKLNAELRLPIALWSRIFVQLGGAIAGFLLGALFWNNYGSAH
ncbi:hypothetical protein [Chitinolyticbacter meiyuanensis]|uniref:hypothetical protein n=1 Tax=Chitinolyticbacter meiyuanensis TaxID=682798 RepID=UPI0011E5BF12|nr:hypothetical protein [Chitinolyticbacter meiyuanensis]